MMGNSLLSLDDQVSGSASRVRKILTMQLKDQNALKRYCSQECCLYLLLLPSPPPSPSSSSSPESPSLVVITTRLLMMMCSVHVQPLHHCSPHPPRQGGRRRRRRRQLTITCCHARQNLPHFLPRGGFVISTDDRGFPACGIKFVWASC